MYVPTDKGLKAWPLSGMLPPNVFLPQSRSVDLLGLNRRQSYETIYRTQPWVYTVVNKLARGIGRLPVNALDAAKNVATDTDLQRLLDRPYPRASGFQLREATTGSLAIYGNALTVKDRGDRLYGPVQSLWPVPWRFVTPIMGENEPIGAYLVMVGGVRRLFMPDDVIHHQWWSPEGLLGVSPLEPLRNTLAIEDAAQRYTMNSFANGGRPSGAVTTEKNIQKKDRDELRAEIEATYAGIDNQFRIALLTHGLDWKPMSHNAVDSELVNQRKLDRDEVMACYDIQPTMIGILDHASRNNLEETHAMLYQDTYGPWYVVEEGGWDRQLCDNERPFMGMSTKYDTGEVLRGNPDARSTAAQRWFQSAIKTPNEGRADEDLDPVPGSMLENGDPDPNHPANQVYIPVNMLPAKDIERSIDLQPESEPGGVPAQGGENNDPVTASQIREFIKLAEAAGLSFNGNGGVHA